MMRTHLYLKRADANFGLPNLRTTPEANKTMIDMIHQFVISSGLEYKKVITKIDEIHALSLRVHKELGGDYGNHQK